MRLNKRVFGYEMTFLSKTATAIVVASMTVSGCTSMQLGDTMYNGYVIDQQQMRQFFAFDLDFVTHVALLGRRGAGAAR